MNLQYNIEQKVNQKQYNFVKSKLSSLIAYRENNGEYFIKPLSFQGHKKLIEEALTNIG
jgi:hypothetical protein